MVQLLWKTVWQYLIKLSRLLPYDPEISLIGFYTRERKYVHTKICTWKLIAVFLVIAESWKQTKCPPTGKKIRRLWQIPTIQYSSAVEGMNCWDTQKHGWISKILCWVRETSLSRILTVWFHLVGKLQSTKLWRWKYFSGFPGFWVGVGWLQGDGTVEFRGCQNCFISPLHESIHVLKFIDLYTKKMLILFYDHLKTLTTTKSKDTVSSDAMFGYNSPRILGLQCLGSRLLRHRGHSP